MSPVDQQKIRRPRTGLAGGAALPVLVDGNGCAH